MTWIMFYALFEKESWNEKYEITPDYKAEYDLNDSEDFNF